MKSIFIVDDNETDRIIAREALAQEYQVYLVASANRMLEMFDKVIPDLILLDINMPGIDGYAALMTIKEDSRLKGTAILMLSAYGREDVIKKCVKIGAEGFVIKPFDKEYLRHIVKKTIGRGGLL